MMEKFKIISANISNDNYEILKNKFGLEFLGYYYEIINILLNQKNYLYKIKDLKKMSKTLKISHKKLTTFIELCSNCYNKKGIALLSLNDKYFWNDTILVKLKQYQDRKEKLINTGRKKCSLDECLEFKNFKYVNLTYSQYNNLISKYGKIFTDNAINILNKWLSLKSKEAKKYLNKNNYGHFRKDSWVMNATKKLLECFDGQKIFTPDSVFEMKLIT